MEYGEATTLRSLLDTPVEMLSTQIGWNSEGSTFLVAIIVLEVFKLTELYDIAQTASMTKKEQSRGQSYESPGVLQS
jgi:hypothetical protein